MRTLFKILRYDEQPDALRLLGSLNYITDPLATRNDLIYGSFVSCRYPYEEMMLAKRCHASAHARTLDGKNYYAYILSLPSELSDDVSGFSACMREVNEYIATYRGHRFQVIHAIHTNTNDLHAHFIANSIDFITGERFDLSPTDEFPDMRAGIERILIKHGFPPLYELHGDM